MDSVSRAISMPIANCSSLVSNDFMRSMIQSGTTTPGTSFFMNNAFNEADFAIGSLARHRSGIDKIKTLKNREYAARGIPFVYSETDGDFDKMPYILKVPADESPIDIHRLIRFYMELDLSPRKIRDSIKNLSWKEQMMKVINNL